MANPLRRFETPLTFPKNVFRPPAVGTILKHEDSPDDLPGLITDGRAAVCDRQLAAVPAGELCVIGQADNYAFTENPLDRGLYALAGLLVPDVEYLVEWLPSGFLQCPTSCRLGGRVHERDAPLSISCDHGVGDALEGHRQQLFAPALGLFSLHAVGDVEECAFDPDGSTTFVLDDSGGRLDDELLATTLLRFNQVPPYESIAR